MTMRLYSAGLQVFWAIIKVRRAIVSHDASIISVIIKGSARLRRWTDLRMVPKKVDWVTTAQVAVGLASPPDFEGERQSWVVHLFAGSGGLQGECWPMSNGYL